MVAILRFWPLPSACQLVSWSLPDNGGFSSGTPVSSPNWKPSKYIKIRKSGRTDMVLIWFGWALVCQNGSRAVYRGTWPKVLTLGNQLFILTFKLSILANKLSTLIVKVSTLANELSTLAFQVSTLTIGKTAITKDRPTSTNFGRCHLLLLLPNLVWKTLRGSTRQTN